MPHASAHSPRRSDDAGSVGARSIPPRLALLYAHLFRHLILPGPSPILSLWSVVLSAQAPTLLSSLLVFESPWCLSFLASECTLAPPRHSPHSCRDHADGGDGMRTADRRPSSRAMCCDACHLCRRSCYFAAFQTTLEIHPDPIDNLLLLREFFVLRSPLSPHLAPRRLALHFPRSYLGGVASSRLRNTRPTQLLLLFWPPIILPSYHPSDPGIPNKSPRTRERQLTLNSPSSVPTLAFSHPTPQPHLNL
jgi:hypothetical protein